MSSQVRPFSVTGTKKVRVFAAQDTACSGGVIFFFRVNLLVETFCVFQLGLREMRAGIKQ